MESSRRSIEIEVYGDNVAGIFYYFLLSQINVEY